MRRLLVATLLMLVVLVGGVSIAPLAHTASASPAPAHAHDEPARFRDGFVLVGFDSGLSKQDQHQAEAAVHAHEVQTLGVGVHLLSVPDGQVTDAVHLLSSYPGVRYAEPDYLSHVAATPNDPSFPIQWADQNTGQTVNGAAGTPADDERTVAAWKVTTGSRNIVIGEVDTGVEYTHPDLAANIWTNPGGIGGCAAGTHGYNVLNASCDPMDNDVQYGGHGTHVAGIMGAVGNNGIGVSGVNWTTTILPVKWVGPNGGGATSDLIAGLDWLLKAKQAGVNIRVVNDSTVFYGTAYSQALSDEIDLLGKNNILFVTAAGNTSDDNDNPAVRRYPCGYDLPTEICVAASNQNDALPSWANYGPATVDLVAPGNNIYSTIRGATYGFINGSSMASPQVAGAAALILSVKDMSATQLKADLLENVDLVPGLSGRVRTGGRLDICKALPGCDSSASTGVVPPLQATSTFGLSSVGANSDWMGADRKRVNHYQLATSASVSKLSMYLQPTSTSGQQVIKGVIYADQAGVPGALVAVGSPLTYSSTQAAGWYDLPFASPVALAAGTYWIGVLSGATYGVAGFRYTSVSGARAINANSYSSGPSDPFGPPSIDSEQMSLYATYTYTPTPAATPSAPFAVTPPHVTMAGKGGFFSPQVGQALSSDGGVWDRSPTGYTYQWLRCTSVGEGCSAIAGATSASYVPTNADGGSTLRVSITAANTGGSATSVSAPTQIVQAAPANAPANTFGTTTIGASTDPSGTSAERVQVYPVGQNVTVTKLTVYLMRYSSGQQVLKGLIYADQGGVPGRLLGVSSEVTFGTTATTGWYDLPFAAPVALAAGTYWIGLIDGASRSVFALAYDNGPANSSDLIYPTYSSGPPNPFGSGALQTEQMSLYATYTVAQSVAAAPANSAPPTISGTAQMGQTLTSTTGTWTNSPTMYATQWSRCDVNGANCAAISGAAAASYTVAPADVGDTLKVSVTASNSGGSAAASSAPTQIVQAAPANAPANTFGTTTIGASTDPSGTSAERVQVYPVGQNVTVTKLTVYLMRYSSGQQVLKGLIYADQGGVPGNLLGVSSEVTFGTTATTGWYDLPFASPVALAAGTYWIGLIDGASRSVFALAYDNGPANSSDLIYPTYSSGPPNPFGSGALQTEQMSLYATYTVAQSVAAAPANSAPSTASGSVQEGQTLTSTTGTWTNGTRTNRRTVTRSTHTVAGSYRVGGGFHIYSDH